MSSVQHNPDWQLLFTGDPWLRQPMSQVLAWQSNGQNTPQTTLEESSTSATQPTHDPGEVRVMSLQTTGVPSNSSFARLLTPFPELRDFTVCYRIRQQRYRKESTLMSYALSDNEDRELMMDHRKTGYKVSLHGNWATSSIITQMRQWAHFCFQYGFQTGNWVIFMNGKIYDNGTLPKTTLPLRANGVYIIGQEQDELGGGFQRDQSYSGEITQLNIWSRELDKITIQKVEMKISDVYGLIHVGEDSLHLQPLQYTGREQPYQPASKSNSGCMYKAKKPAKSSVVIINCAVENDVMLVLRFVPGRHNVITQQKAKPGSSSRLVSSPGNLQGILRMSECTHHEEGDALPWTHESWKISGDVTWVTYKHNEICNQSKRRIVIFPDRFTLAGAMHVCQVFGGSVAVPKNDEENAWIFNSSKHYAQSCSGDIGASFLWLGAEDQQEEGVWRYLQRNETLPWQGRWREDEPKGGKMENCMVMLFGNFPGYWSDIACLASYEFCVPCEFEELKVIYLKGPAVCPRSPFNSEYYLGEERGGRPSFIGLSHSDIYWDTDMVAWVLKSLKFEATAWWKPPEEGMYPYGTQLWTMGSKVCNITAGETTSLTFSVCGKGLFTCSDGTCIDLNKRCDLRVDCSDQSDEAGCSLLNIPAGYMANIPPPPTTRNEPLHILFTINIMSFPSIKTDALAFEALMELTLRWKDTRLTYLNLKDDGSLNVLTESAVSQVWKPKVFFSNAQDNLYTNVDEGSRIECIHDGNSVGTPHLEDEVITFSGRDTSLQITQLYSANYSCDFYLLMFPFDQQVCHLRFTLVSASTSYMTLVPTNVSYTGPPSLIEYVIGRVTNKTVNEGEFSKVDVQVKFRRRYGFYMLNIYIPTVLIVISAYTSFFYNPYDFNSRVVVALTAKVVLYTLYSQTSNSLPKTSYFKFIDIWLFFAMVAIFVVVLLQTLVDYSAQGDFSGIKGCLSKTAEKLQRKEPSGTDNDSFYEDESTCAANVLSCFKPEEKVDRIEDKAAGLNWPGNRPPSGFWSASMERPSIPRTPSYTVGPTQQVMSPKVNESLMRQCRYFTLAVFLLFNALYWGAVAKYLNSLDAEEKEPEEISAENERSHIKHLAFHGSSLQLLSHSLNASSCSQASRNFRFLAIEEH
ncbi:uncharacterized protein [Macrobrachium rosenbergii]|uniref:uncharacterized protein n=1 Tax=Macrobrachium rosenbergii TaxID=79674 RepID=UPI0034D39E51